jgi:hypothetical protein
VEIECPVCRTKTAADVDVCPTCRADLRLLASLRNDVKAQLERAEQLRREGQLAAAVGAYLVVLDADPANAEARAALGPVLTALRAPKSVAGSAILLIAGAAIAALAFTAGYWLAR